MNIATNVTAVRARIAKAAASVGRDPVGITLVAAAKSTDAAGIRQALAAGVTHFGENRVQDAEEKLAQLTDVRTQATWHMIGHLQSNKAKRAAELFDMVESVDSVSIGEALERRSARRLPIYIEVNVGAEPNKTGLPVSELDATFRKLSQCRHLEVRGLMTVAPQVASPDDVRSFFRQLWQLGQGLGLKELSMGMTDDFEIAIQEGATSVRIGRALFHVQA